MRVCVCENRELLSIEDRLEGVRQLYCENFAGCLPPPRGEAAPKELMPLETSGLVYMRAVNEELEKHHVLETHPGPPVPTPMLPTATTLAPMPERRLAAPLVGILGLASLAGAILLLESSRFERLGGGVPPGAQASLAQVGFDDSEKSARAPDAVRPAGFAPGPLAPDRAARRSQRRGRAVVASAPLPPSRVVSRRRAKRRAAPPPRRLAERTPPMLAPMKASTPLSAPVVAPLPTTKKPDDPTVGRVHAGVEPMLGGASLELMLKAATGKTGTVLPPPEVLPKRMGVKDISAAQRQLRRGAGRCLRKFGFTHLTARVRIRVRGDRGRVTWAGVEGRLKGTPAGRCIERAARRLRTRRFQQSRQVFTAPIRVH